MVPTAEGHRLLVQVRYALSLLEGVFRPARKTGTKRLVISVLPSLAAHWLVPRLGEFRASFPHIELNLQPSSELEEFGSGADAAIRYGPGGWPEVQSSLMCGENLSPMCSPAYLLRHQIVEPADLARCTLLRNAWQPWAKWLDAAGVGVSEPVDGPEYTTELGIQAAMAGEGMLLGRGLLAADQLRAGTLVRPFRLAVAANYQYFLVKPRRSAPELEAFVSWLRPKMAGEADAAAAGLTLIP